MPVNDVIRKTEWRALKRAAKILAGKGFLPMQNLYHQGPFDFVGISPKYIAFVRVKVVNRGPLPSYEKLLETLTNIAVPAGCIKALWVWERQSGFHYFTLPGANRIL